ncbi:MAG: hypothetical protein GX434_07390 [Peptococcaceae bacterium]|nr:hypothetical protein [Peptococcaceae bacterium]
MKMKPSILSLIIFLVIFGTVGVTAALDLWKTTNTKQPAQYQSGELAGQNNPADIRGSYTFADINKAFGIPIEDLGKAFGVKDSNQYAAFQCKQLETIYAPLAAQGKEVGTGSVRLFVALYKGLPIALDDGTYLPKSAVEILLGKGSLSPEQIDFIQKHSVETP